MTKVSGRYLAQLILNGIEQDDSYANLLLSRVFQDYSAIIDQREKALCTELVYGTLRHLLKIDFILGRLLNRPFTSLKIPVKNILRLAIYQLLYLPGIPERAVCHSAVEQIKQSKYSGLAPVVNGVLRSYLRLKNEIRLPDPVLERAEYLSLEYSHPLWLVNRWLDNFGPHRTEQILKTNNEQPPFTLRVNRHLTTSSKLTNDLTGQGIESRPGLFLPEAISIGPLTESIAEMTLFKAGQIFVQDENAMLVAHLVKPEPGELILDLCSAPGGKSTHLAELTGDRGEIWSLDNHPHKIKLIEENASRLQLHSIRAVLGDARDYRLPPDKLADAVLVDAPCSGTGVLRRRVDARYRRSLEDIGNLVEIQKTILNNAASLVKPGGRMVFCTCTLEPEENQQQITRFLEDNPEFEITDYHSFLPDIVDNYAVSPNSKWLTILPIPGGGDGFFMCRIDKHQK
jgi:16S rRNA (cytosine967-C5)-methyltransferase